MTLGRCARSQIFNNIGLNGSKIVVGGVGCGYSISNTDIVGTCPPTP
jgi:hypothetical protein